MDPEILFNAHGRIRKLLLRSIRPAQHKFINELVIEIRYNKMPAKQIIFESLILAQDERWRRA